jgi:hypothetical protein
MYPYIQLWELKLYMTWVWIVLWIICFLILIYHYTRRYWLNFWKFFNRLPLWLILPYLLGSYSYYLIEFKLFFPTDISQFMMILSPFSYEFNFIGICLWLLISLVLFINSLKIYSEKLKWMDIFFYSFSLSMVPMWLFFLLWDDFIWTRTDSFLAIQSLTENSNLSKYWQVYPYWLFFSFLGIFSFIFTFIIHSITKKYGSWLLGIAILLFGFNFLFIFQQYTKHLVYGLSNNITIDFQNYFVTILSILCLFYYIYLNKKKH